MIRIHCTKKLYSKLPLDTGGRLLDKKPSPYAANDEPETRLSGWHANLILLQRRQCILFVHDETRFPVFLPALKKSQLAELDYWFTDGFMNTLLKSGADEELMERAHAALGPLIFDQDCNRSVQATMNQMVQDLSYEFIYGDSTIAESMGYSIGARLADRPCSVKGRKDVVWPPMAMREMLTTQPILQE